MNSMIDETSKVIAIRVRMPIFLLALSGLLLLTGVAAAEDVPDASGLARSGAGVFVKVTRGGRTDPEILKHALQSPLVAGVQVSVSWSELEPRKDGFDWRELDQLLAECDAAHKRVALLFTAADGKVPTPSQLKKGKGRSGPDVIFNNKATPVWLFDDHDVHRLGGIQSEVGRLPLYPVFWDTAYQQHFGEFLAAFSKRYDGDPRIEFIRMGGWQIGTSEPSFYGGAVRFIRGQLSTEGEAVEEGRKPKLSSTSQYARAVKDLIDLWHQSFRETRLAATIHLDRGKADSFERAMNDHCASKGCLLLNTGLNERDHTPTRQFFRKMRKEHGCETGWGGITHLGGKREKGRKKKKVSAQILLEAFKQGIGSDEQPRYAPASKVSYVVIGPGSLERTEAVQWLAQHLKP